MKTPIALSTAVALVVASVALGVIALSSDEYELKVLAPTAAQSYAGAQVMIDGETAGQVTDVGVLDDKALITVAVDDDYAPLPAGTTARMNWDSVIGTRPLELLPAPEANPPLDSGKMIVSHIERVEIDDLFATLDAPTRHHVHGLLTQLNQTLQGREQHVNGTLKTAGPTMNALGEVVRAVGADGPAIRDLVKRLHRMTTELAQRDVELGQTVRNLGQFTSVTADKQESLKVALRELPATVRQASFTLERVPRAVGASVPLLNDLRPGVARLPSVARNLNPVLRDLRPTVAELKPTLYAAQSLLHRTPGFLDSAHATFPGVKRAVTTLEPAVAFLRPYTPELAGWLANWTSLFGSQTPSGNYVRALIPTSATAFNDNPGILPPGLKQDPRPAPGSNVGQPWTDANGDGIR